MVSKSCAAEVFCLGAGIVLSASTALAQCPADQLLAEDGIQADRFGRSVAVIGDTIAVGARFQDAMGPNSGALYVFNRQGESWIQQQKLTGSDLKPGDWFGFSLGMDEGVIIGGAIFADGISDGTGAAYVFRYDGLLWQQEQKLFADDSVPGDWFGAEVAIAGDVAIVGAPFHASGAGAAYIFRFDGIGWVQEQKLVASDGVAGDDFGIFVDVDGDVAVVGAELATVNGKPFAGAAYVFRYDGQSWIEEQKLVASDAATLDEFGVSVAVRGNTIAVSAWHDNALINGKIRPNAGSVYIFEYDGAQWVQVQKLVAADGSDDDTFGVQLALNDGVLLVGARLDDDNGEDSGSAYLFVHDGAQWVQQHKFLAPLGQVRDWFGRSVAVSPHWAVVGTPRANDLGVNAGSTWVFDLTDPDMPEVCPVMPPLIELSLLAGQVVAGDADSLLWSDNVALELASTPAANGIHAVDLITEYLSPLMPVAQLDLTLEASVSTASPGLFGQGTGVPATLALNDFQLDQWVPVMTVGLQPGDIVFSLPDLDEPMRFFRDDGLIRARLRAQTTVVQTPDGFTAAFDRLAMQVSPATGPASVGACRADCTADGVLDVFDLLCFQGLLSAGDPAADCNGDGSLTIFDLICFQGQFELGCP